MMMASLSLSLGLSESCLIADKEGIYAGRMGLERNFVGFFYEGKVQFWE